MSRLLSHLPQIASLALAVLAAAVSHGVHADRRRARPRASRATRPPGHGRAPTKARTTAFDAPIRARREEGETSRAPALGSGRRRAAGRAAGGGDGLGACAARGAPMSAPTPCVHAHAPRHVDRLRAEPGAVHGVDPPSGSSPLTRLSARNAEQRPSAHRSPHHDHRLIDHAVG